MVDANNAYTEVCNLVMLQAMTLDERLACILQSDGGKKLLPSNIHIEDVHGFNGMSGYNYWDGDTLIAQLYLGTLTSGTYVIYKRTFVNNELNEVYDYYDNEGNFFHQSNSLDNQCVTYSSIAMDPTSPFVNHMYNILYLEYEGAKDNFGETNRIKVYENIIRKFYKSDEYKISANDGLKDAALKNIKNEIIKIENDEYLKWDERQTIFKKLREIRGKILKTKRRVHNRSFFSYDFIVFLTNFILRFQLIKRRPVNNLRGFIYRHTIGHVLWFTQTARNNIGFAVAMAIWTPFTFYFITQPINPHAMWVVGKLRNAYLNVEEVILQENNLKDVTNKLDMINTALAANKKSDVKVEPQVDWHDRMSDFKAMQIAYEADLVPAERFGRIEQFETQFNFPLTAEAAWMEMEMYVKALDSALDFKAARYDRRYKLFLKSEKRRTLELQHYIWQKVGQFFIDHPYIVVDQDGEQPEKNYYLGRQFVFFKKMTDKILKLGLDSAPKTHPMVAQLAERYKKMKVEGASVLDTLEKNSQLFKQKDFYSSKELRSYMKRQWEVLFLQQNKKQESASYALQAYTWSIKNAMWLMQTIHSAKRNELATLTYKYNLNNQNTGSVTADPSTNEYLENMFHNLAIEFVSIKREMKANLPNDNEADLRVDVINNLKQYIMERDRLLNTGVYASIHEDEKTIQ
ncbi:MAG: hypothetical protein CME62_11235 [Halobacteriovoraceae bacterium]|nr:hypothetical protein [Halobacteriovoraceae bacterium]